VNLVSNAIHTEAGSIKLTCEQPMPSGITVSDTGIGIKPEDEAHIFEPFFRVDADNQSSTFPIALVLDWQLSLGW